jgi:mRNA interferase MazF
VTVPEAGQGDVWDCQLNPIAGHEQAGQRPCLVVSVDQLGRGPSELAIVVPITRTNRTALDVRVEPPAGGLTDVSFLMPYQLRTVSRERLLRRRGVVSDELLREVIARVHLLTKSP